MFLHGDFLVSPCGLESGLRSGKHTQMRQLQGAAHSTEAREGIPPCSCPRFPDSLDRKTRSGGRAVWLSQAPECVKPSTPSCQITNSYPRPAGCSGAKGEVSLVTDLLFVHAACVFPVLCERHSSLPDFPQCHHTLFQMASRIWLCLSLRTSTSCPWGSRR